MNQQEVLDARYGRSRRSRRGQFIFGVSVAVATSVGFLIWAVFVTQTNATTPTGNALSYRVISASQTQVTYSVDNANNRVISCELQALDSGYQVVGDTQVDYPATGGQQTILVNTVSRAVTGIVKACWVK